MAILLVKSLLCIDTEDPDSRDECILEVYHAGGTDSIRHDLSPNETWTINKEYTFNGKVSIKLWDEDLGHWPDYHDCLGENVIPEGAVTDGAVEFKREGYEYKLTYDVR